MVIAVTMALPWLCAGAQRSPEAGDGSLTVSLITCYPGPEIYELCGHEAVRVRGTLPGGVPIDSVWNYGIFDFNEPNFVYRFVKGETDYMGAGYPFGWFMPEYERRGSKVVEQDLNLTAEETGRLLALLRKSALPEYRKYRYSYIGNNCATRITAMLDSALGVQVVYPDSVRHASYRDEMRAYHRNYPWYQFGIDLALGSGLDRSLDARREMFVPVEMMRHGAGARLPDGRPLVRETRVLNEGLTDATLGPTPWYASPLPWSWVWFAVVCAVSAAGICTGRGMRWFYCLWFTLLGLAGCLLAFLVFVSSHDATSPNILLLWLNPLQFVIAVCMWWRATRAAAIGMACADVTAMVALLAVWPFQAQSANPAFFPLMAATLVAAASYAIIAFRNSYKYNTGRPRRTAPRKPRRKK